MGFKHGKGSSHLPALLCACCQVRSFHKDLLLCITALHVSRRCPGALPPLSALFSVWRQETLRKAQALPHHPTDSVHHALTSLHLMSANGVSGPQRFTAGGGRPINGQFRTLREVVK